jgi:2-C-methyl-D-erythritol 2,4-cyclodiphosphate synthase
MLKFSKQKDFGGSMDIRIGHGIDFHQYDENRKMVLGGVVFDVPYGLLGHSDADVVLHAVADSLLGSCGLKDIGYHFPDTDDSYKNADSSLLLEQTVNLVREKGFEIANIDITVIAQKPKINPKREEMVNKIAMLLGIDKERVSVKGTTTEKMGFIGREEGMAAMATVLVFKK